MDTSRSTRSRAALGLLAALVAVAAVTSAADAAVIGSSVTGFEGGPALASDGRVVVGERRGHGARRILAIDPATRATTELAAFPAFADAFQFPVLSLSGTGGVVTAAVDGYREATPAEAQRGLAPRLLHRRTTTVLPGLTPLASCSQVPVTRSVDAAGGDGFVASVGEDCATSATGVVIRTATGAYTIPAAPGPSATIIHSLRAAGPMVGWFESDVFVIARAATGQVRRIAIHAPFRQVGLGSDGTVAYIASSGCSLHVISPGASAPGRIDLPAGVCPARFQALGGQNVLAVAGGRIVYPAGTGYAVTDLAGNAHALPEAAIGVGQGSPVAFDGRTVYVFRSDCDADRLLAIDADAIGTLPPTPRQPTPCPARRSGPGLLRVARDGRVGVGMLCEAGCRGTLRLLQRRGSRERVVADKPFSGAPGGMFVRPLIPRWVKRLASCSGGLRVIARVYLVGDDRGNRSIARPTSFGGYRIRSSLACRRTGGPRFASAPHAPRP